MGFRSNETLFLGRQKVGYGILYRITVIAFDAKKQAADDLLLVLFSDGQF